VQLVVGGDLEIEGATIAMGNGADASAVSLPKRHLARKWLFATHVVPPVVIAVCARALVPTRPPPAFRITTWKETAP
jgi:hypothetical protein